jgi:hypothetical protein
MIEHRLLYVEDVERSGGSEGSGHSKSVRAYAGADFENTFATA